MSIRRRFEFLKGVWQSYSKDHGSLLAAAVSFYAFLSLFPLLLLAVGVLGFVLRSPQHAEAVLTRMIGSYVVEPNTMSIVQETIHGRDAATGIGLIALLWTGTSALAMLEQAMNLAWKTTERRSFFRRRMIALFTLLVSGLLLALSLGATTLLHAVSVSNSAIASNLGLVWHLLAYLLPLLASIALFAIMFKLLPSNPVMWRTAVVGGVFSGILWEVAKHGFTYYAVHFANYSKVYGSLASVILLMVWIDYTAVITILGAEFASAWGERHGDRAAA